MARQFLVSVDLTKNELQNARVQNLATAPSTPVTGQIYFDTSTTPGVLYYWDGTIWVAAKGGSPTGAAGGDLTGTYPNPTIASAAVTGAKIASGTITDTNVASANKDGATSTASLRTLGTGATQATAGNDSRLSDSRPPNGTAGGSLSGTYPNPTIGTGVITDTNVAAGNKDGVSGTASLRTLGTGALQATAGNDTRLSDARTPTAGSVTDSSVNGAAAIQFSKIATPTAATSWNSQRITNLADPSSSQDAATKNYVDNAVQGLDTKASARVATTANITLSAPQTIDGVSVIAGDRVLVKDQSTGSQNGVYVVAAGAWTRASDMDTWAEVPGAYVFVEVGTANADSGWVVTADQGGTIGSTAITWVQFSGAGQVIAGAGLTKTGNSIDVGAGTGISVAADSVAVDTAVVVRKYAVTIGDGSTTAIGVVHNLGTADITYSLRRVSDNAFVEADAVSTSTTTLTLTFAAAPASSALRVVVHA